MSFLSILCIYPIYLYYRCICRVVLPLYYIVSINLFWVSLSYIWSVCLSHLQIFSYQSHWSTLLCCFIYLSFIFFPKHLTHQSIYSINLICWSNLFLTIYLFYSSYLSISSIYLVYPYYLQTLSIYSKYLLYISNFSINLIFPSIYLF